ncbi:MAG: thiol-activated cytolysin family protein [Motiliproteus sp.]
MMRNVMGLRITVILFAFFLQSCEQQEQAESKPPESKPPAMVMGDTLNEVDNYFLNLPKWEDISAPIADDPGTEQGHSKTSVEGKYECINQDYSLAKTPAAIVLFDNTAATLWPGSILQSRPYINGHFAQLPIADQAPIALTINISIPEPSVTVENPSYETMQTAISTLVARGKGTSIPAVASYNSREVYSLEQLLLDFNLSAKYMNQNAKASLKINSKIETKTISAYFVQNMFTVSVPTPRTPSSYFNTISMDDIENQEAQDRIGKNNPPLYVESVSYGRILLFTMTSTHSESDIQAALDYAYTGGADVDAKTKAHYKNVLSTAEINVVPYGGRWEDAAQLIKSANIRDYFSDKEPPLTTAVPISYKLNTLARGETAKVAEVTSYTQRECHIKETPAVKKNARFTLQYVGGGDNRYLSIAEWWQVGLVGKFPYPTLQLKPVKLHFKGGNDALTSGSNIRFSTLEAKAGGKKLGKLTELGAWNAKKTVFYDKPDSSSKQNWVFTKKCSGNCDKYIRYGDKVTIRNEKKSKQYLCNDSGKKSRYLVTKKSKCTWQIGR